MVQLIGRITKNASINETNGGRKVVNFSIALNDGYKNKQGEWIDAVTFINCAYGSTPVKLRSSFTKAG